MNSFRFRLVSLALALSAATAANAQFGSFPGWADYDSTFYVGSDVAANVHVAMDELTIDYHWGNTKRLRNGWTITIITTVSR